MVADYQCTRVLVVAMTYPHPSETHQELVCTAGITEGREWVRLYPVDYRYLPNSQKFKTYQWIQVDLLPHSQRNDKRKESRKPKVDSIRLGEWLSTRNEWRERRQIINPMPHHTLNELKLLYKRERASLGILRPKRVLDVEIRPDKSEWKPRWRTLFSQYRLFGQQKPLRKIPYKFYYIFECKDSVAPQRAMIEDWGLGVLFLKESDRLGSDDAAAKSVKEKYLSELCGRDKDTRFFMGTRFPYNTWLVIGVFWPPKSPEDEQYLFP